MVDRRGSSRSVSRTFCKQCGTFVDEVPAEFQKERRKAAEQALAATEEALSMIQYTTSEDATRELNSDEVESVLSIFTDDIMESMAMGISMTPNVMHGRLKEAISRSRMLSNDEPSPGVVLTLGRELHMLESSTQQSSPEKKISWRDGRGSPVTSSLSTRR